MNPTTHPAVARYLKDLEKALREFPPARRNEIVEEISGHITEASVGVSAEPDESTIRTLLDQVGDPEVIAEEAREHLGITKAKAGFLEGAAIALLLVGGIVLPLLGWIVGVVLLWMSRVWTTRDKLIGTFLVPGGLALVLGLLLFTASTTTTVCEAFIDGGAFESSYAQHAAQAAPPICPPGAEGTPIWGTLLLAALIIIPIATTIYLGRRAWKPS